MLTTCSFLQLKKGWAKWSQKLQVSMRCMTLEKSENFLAMEIMCNHAHWTITIDQCQYVQKILKKFKLEKAQPVLTPMATNSKLPKLDALEIDQWLYQSMLGSLMYAAIGTHPDIMYAIHSLSQFSIAPGPACKDRFPLQVQLSIQSRLGLSHRLAPQSPGP